MEEIHQVFFELVRAGLWEKEACLAPYGDIDFCELYRLAQEQSVEGLVTAGLEHVKDIKLPQEFALAIAGDVLQIEQRNRAMNKYLVKLIEEMRRADIYAILVKGQGVAQCYERPLWRSSGDIDLLLSEENYRKAKLLLVPKSSLTEKEDVYEQHLGLRLDSWIVELHGNMRTGAFSRLDKEVDLLQDGIFYSGIVRSWLNGNTQIFLPGVNIDILLIFTHILKHFYKEGVGLRQFCDLSRLLWVYRDVVDRNKLECIIKKMGVNSEWKTVAWLLVYILGMDERYMPLYSDDEKWRKKAERMLSMVFESGNMGHNRDISYQQKYGPLRRRFVTFALMTKKVISVGKLFPLNAIKSWGFMTIRGLQRLA